MPRLRQQPPGCATVSAVSTRLWRPPRDHLPVPISLSLPPLNVPALRLVIVAWESAPHARDQHWATHWSARRERSVPAPGRSDGGTAVLPHLYARRVAALTPGPSRAAPRRRRQRAPACAIRPAGAAGAIGATSGLGKPVSRDRAASRDCMACTASFGVPSGTCVVILTRYSTVTSSSSERLPRSMSPLRAAFSVVYGPPPLRPCNTLVAALVRGADAGDVRRRWP